MSTSIAGAHTDTTSVSVVTNAQLAESYPEIHEDDAQRVLALESPLNSQLIVIEGDLEEFARDVWKAVFGVPRDDAPDPAGS